MYTHLYPAKVLYIHNPKYFYFRVDVWPQDLSYKVNLNLSIEDGLWESWSDEDKKREYTNYLVNTFRNKVVFIDVPVNDPVGTKPLANMYVPCTEGNILINGHKTLIYPDFLKAWQSNQPVDIENLNSIYRF